MGTVTKGNVFEDLGFSAEESELMALQVFLGEQIRNEDGVGSAVAFITQFLGA